MDRIAALSQRHLQCVHGGLATALTRAARLPLPRAGASAALCQHLLQAQHQRLQALTAGLHHQVRNLAVQGVALRVQLAQPRQRVGRLQQRAVAVVAGAVPQIVDGRAQVHDGAARVQQPAVLLVEHRPAPGGEHDLLQRGQLLDHGRLARAESRLALQLEDHRDLHPGAAFDHLVRVVERLAQVAREHLPDGGLARPHHAHQEDVLGHRAALRRAVHDADSSLAAEPQRRRRRGLAEGGSAGRAVLRARSARSAPAVPKQSLCGPLRARSLPCFSAQKRKAPPKGRSWHPEQRGLARARPYRAGSSASRRSAARGGRCGCFPA